MLTSRGLYNPLRAVLRLRACSMYSGEWETFESDHNRGCSHCFIQFHGGRDRKVSGAKLIGARISSLREEEAQGQFMS